MEFNPPIINHINDVLPHIKDKNEIVHIVKDRYQVLDYVYVLATTFDNPYARECRGLKFDLDGNLIGRPYHKFKNLNEDGEYSTVRVDLTLPHVRLDKLDGSMVHNCSIPCINSKGNPYKIHTLMTRKGESEVAIAAKEWLFSDNNVDSDLTDKHISMWEWYSAWTFIYEYVGPNNKIVIDYPEENLILTGIRDKSTGEYKTYNQLKKIAEGYGVPYVGLYEGIDVANDPDKEGCIIRFDTGAMVKMKSDIYVRKHRSKDLVTKFKDLVKLIVEGNLDDILPQLDEETYDRVVEYRDELEACIVDSATWFHEFNEKWKHKDQKSFALMVTGETWSSSAHASLMFATRKSGTAGIEIRRCIQRACSDTSRLTTLFDELNLPIWKGDFFNTEE